LWSVLNASCGKPKNRVQTRRLFAKPRQRDSTEFQEDCLRRAPAQSKARRRRPAVPVCYSISPNTAVKRSPVLLLMFSDSCSTRISVVGNHYLKPYFFKALRRRHPSQLLTFRNFQVGVSPSRLRGNSSSRH